MNRCDYSDLDYLRTNLKIGHSLLVSSDIDVQILQLLYGSTRLGTPLVLGTPFAPCHWSAIALAYHLTGHGNHDLSTKRRVVWLRASQSEFSFVQRLKNVRNFGRLFDSVEVRRTNFSENGGKTTELLLTDDLTDEIASQADAVIISDPVGLDDTSRTSGASLRKMAIHHGIQLTIILPSNAMASDLDGLFWPFSFATISASSSAYMWRDKHLHELYANGSYNAAKTNRFVRPCHFPATALSSLESAAKSAAALSNSRLDWNSKSLIFEYQRIVSFVRQICIPIDEILAGVGGIDERIQTLKNRLPFLQIEIRDEIEIGLLHLADVITEIALNNTKWAAFEEILISLPKGSRLQILQPQGDATLDARYIAYARRELERLGHAPDQIKVSSDSRKSALHEFSGFVIGTAPPKYRSAAYWRFPFSGSLYTLCYPNDLQRAIWANLDERRNGENIRQESWKAISNISLERFPRLTGMPSMNLETLSAEDYKLAEAIEIPRLPIATNGATNTQERRINEGAPVDVGIRVTLESGDTFSWYPAEEHYILTSAGTSGRVTSVKTIDLTIGDTVIIVDGESYATLSRRLMDTSDAANSGATFLEIFEQWQYLCIEAGTTSQTRRAFVNGLRDAGCEKSEAAIFSWLDLKVLGPDSCADIVKCAFVSKNFGLIQNADFLFEGLQKRRIMHRNLGRWLNRALAASASAAEQSSRIIDPSLNLSLANLRQAIRLQRVMKIEAPNA